MTKQLCRDCKHLETDGMFGIFCGVGGDNTKYNCPKYEQKGVKRMSENALIEKADMVFDDISGKNGRQFKLILSLKLRYGGVNVSFNPLRLPQLLEQLGLECFSELEGTYIQVNDTDVGEEVKGIKSIMAKDNEKWFKTENNIYFGSNFIELWKKE